MKYILNAANIFFQIFHFIKIVDGYTGVNCNASKDILIFLYNLELLAKWNLKKETNQFNNYLVHINKYIHVNTEEINCFSKEKIEIYNVYTKTKLYFKLCWYLNY